MLKQNQKNAAIHVPEEKRKNPKNPVLVHIPTKKKINKKN